MAKVQIKSEKLTPFGGFFPIMEPSPHTLSSAHPSRILFLQLNQFPYCFHIQKREREDETSAENGGYPPTQNGDIRSLFWLFSLMALQN